MHILSGPIPLDVYRRNGSFDVMAVLTTG